MTIPDDTTPMKRCSRGDACVHPMGCWQPATNEYFYAMRAQCKACRLERGRRYYAENHDRERERGRRYYAENADKSCAKNKRWRTENADKVQEYRRRYRAENADKLREKNKRWRTENADKVQEYRRRYSAENADKLREYGKHYYTKNPDKAREKRHRWQAKNPDKAREYSHRRRARKIAAGGIFTAADLELAYRAQKGRCWHCGKKLKGTWHADHLIPLSRGGSNDARNIVLACSVCNLSKGAKLPQEWNGRLF